MDPEQAPVTSSQTAPCSPKRLLYLEGSGMRLAARIEATLAMLLEALDYAQDLQQSAWDFSVEISSLRRLKLSRSDLRWLVAKGLVECAIETTSILDSSRSFRQTERPLFCKKTSFVLTQAGQELARKLCSGGDSVPSPNGRTTIQPSWLTIGPAPGPLVPKWDRERQELNVGAIVVKRFKVPAANQEIVLAAFEEECWPPRIDDPLPPHRELPPKRRLQETIKSLNRNQKPALIRFLGDGTGQGVRWEFCCEKHESRELQGTLTQLPPQ